MVNPSSATSDPQVRRFEPADLPPAAALLADRHRRHRAVEPLLDPAYEDPDATRREIELLLGGDRASAWVATRDGEVTAFLIGVAKADVVWGPNVWIEAAGHAADDPALVRKLYAVAADEWIAEGRNNHHVVVPATDHALVDAWFTLDFGQQHLFAVRDVPPPAFAISPTSELTIRVAVPEDAPALVRLERVLPEHLARSPVFSRLAPSSDEEILAELQADLVDPRYRFFVAEFDGGVIGTSIGCSLELSSGASGLSRPDRAGYLAYAAVLDEARGLGAGRALGEAVLAWARDEGYRSVATDWRSTNLEADRAWRAMGFRPTFRRLHRVIA